MENSKGNGNPAFGGKINPEITDSVLKNKILKRV